MTVFFIYVADVSCIKAVEAGYFVKNHQGEGILFKTELELLPRTCKCVYSDSFYAVCLKRKSPCCPCVMCGFHRGGKTLVVLPRSLHPPISLAPQV